MASGSMDSALGGYNWQNALRENQKFSLEKVADVVCKNELFLNNTERELHAAKEYAESMKEFLTENELYADFIAWRDQQG